MPGIPRPREFVERLSHKQILIGLSIVGCLWQLARAIRPPNLWSATQAQLDYTTGFKKRALLGEFGRALGLDLGNYSTFVMFSLAVLAAFLAALVLASVRLKVYQRLDTAVIATIMWSSFGLAYLANIVGYADIALLALAVIAISLPRGTPQLVGSLVAGIVGVLVHEAYILMLLPLTLLAPTLRILLTSRGNPVALARATAPIVGVFIITVGVAIDAALWAPMTPATANHIFADLQNRAGFPMRPDFVEVMNRGLVDNMRLTLGLWGQDAALLWGLKHCAIVLWPVFALVGFAGWVRLSNAFSGLRLVAACGACACAALAPLLMMAIGWDTERWHAVALITFCGTLFVIADVLPQTRTQRTTLIVLAAIPIGLGQLLMSFQLLDNYVPFQGRAELTYLMRSPGSSWLPAS